MLERIQPRWLVIAAGVAFIAGVIGLYADFMSLSPVLLLIAVLLTILAAILFNTPESAVRAAIAARQAEQRGSAQTAVDGVTPTAEPQSVDRATVDHDES